MMVIDATNNKGVLNVVDREAQGPSAKAVCPSIRDIASTPGETRLTFQESIPIKHRQRCGS